MTILLRVVSCVDYVRMQVNLRWRGNVDALLAIRKPLNPMHFHGKTLGALGKWRRVKLEDLSR